MVVISLAISLVVTAAPMATSRPRILVLATELAGQAAPTAVPGGLVLLVVGPAAAVATVPVDHLLLRMAAKHLRPSLRLRPSLHRCRLHPRGLAAETVMVMAVMTAVTRAVMKPRAMIGSIVCLPAPTLAQVPPSSRGIPTGRWCRGKRPSA